MEGGERGFLLPESSGVRGDDATTLAGGESNTMIEGLARESELELLLLENPVCSVRVLALVGVRRGSMEDATELALSVRFPSSTSSSLESHKSITSAALLATLVLGTSDGVFDAANRGSAKQ